MAANNQAGDILLIGLDQLVPDDRNPNRRREIDSLKASLQEFGQHRPAVVYRKPREKQYTIIAGNHLWLSAQELGWTELQCMVVKDSEQKALRRALADNRVGEKRSFDDILLYEMLESAGDDVPGFDDDFLKGLSNRLGMEEEPVGRPPDDPTDGLGLRAVWTISIPSERSGDIRDRLKEITQECGAEITEDVQA